jgi:hypothetical protein
MVAMLVALVAGLLVLTGAIHSGLGEKRLITPLLQARPGILASAQARFLLRLTWHGFSVLMGVLALILLALIWRPETVLQTALGATGAVFLISGLVDVVVTRGRHIGWPFLTAIGVLALAALALLRAG